MRTMTYFGYSFSPRHREVLAGLARGDTARMIGDALCISEKTVGSYITQLKQRLELRRIQQLTVFAVYYAIYYA